MLLEDIGKEAGEDDIGVGAYEVVAHQFGMFVEERLPSATMIGQHDAFAEFASNGDTDDSRQKSPTGATVDVHHVVLLCHTSESQRERQTAPYRSFGAEDVCGMPLFLQMFLQEFHLPRDAPDAGLIIAYQQNLHN